MTRMFPGLALLFCLLAGCGGNPPPNADQGRARNAPKGANNPADLDDAIRGAINENVAKPLVEMTRNFLESNPSFVEQACKARNFTPLHQAAWNNKSDEATKLLAAGADANARDVDGATPLHSAAFAFGADVITVLLQAGGDVNAKDKNGATALHVAMIADGGGGDKAIPYLLKGKADVNAVDGGGRTPLLYACRRDAPNLEKIKQLIAAGADVNFCPPNGVGPLHWACGGNADLVAVLLAAGAKVGAMDDEGKTPLHYAAQFGQPEIVEMLLKAKADPHARDRKGWSPMALAAEKNHTDTAINLRDAGAKEPSWTPLHAAAIFEKPEKLGELLKDKSDLNRADVYGRTPLFWALRCNDDKAADLLVDAGAELIRADKRQVTVLHIAAWADRPDLVKKAVAAGADVNAADDEGYTALHRAAGAENADIVQFLVAKGAKVNVATRSGRTPLLLGFRAKSPELVKCLLTAGADVLAIDDEGMSLKGELWKVFDKDVKELLEKAIKDAAQKQIDDIYFLYSADNPRALKADAIQATTPNLAALKSYRAMFGPDKKAFAATFVGGAREMAIVNANYDAVHLYAAFRKDLRKNYGPDACMRFDELKLGALSWTLTFPFVDEGRFARMRADVQGERAVCRRYPGFEKQGDVHFVKQGGVWLIDAAFLVPPVQPDDALRMLTSLTRCLEKGRALLAQPGHPMEDVKRAMWEEFRQ